MPTHQLFSSSSANRLLWEKNSPDRLVGTKRRALLLLEAKKGSFQIGFLGLVGILVVDAPSPRSALGCLRVLSESR